jgi:hypothetical protein
LIDRRARDRCYHCAPRRPGPASGRGRIEGGQISAWLKTLGLSAAFVVAGCAATGQRTADDYDPGTLSRAQFLKDSAVCEKQAEADQKQLGHGSMDPTYATFNRMYDACMRASGFTRKEQQ